MRLENAVKVRIATEYNFTPHFEGGEYQDDPWAETGDIIIDPSAWRKQADIIHIDPLLLLFLQLLPWIIIGIVSAIAIGVGVIVWKVIYPRFLCPYLKRKGIVKSCKKRKKTESKAGDVYQITGGTVTIHEES
jgi:hypothetical protein